MNPLADTIIDLYRRHGLALDHKRGRRLFEQAWLDRFLALRPPGPSILDLGCGGAEPMAAYLIGQGCRVTGVDTSPPLLNLARHRFPDHEWIEADMRTLALDRRFDAILAWDSFFHLKHEDQCQMFPLFRRHAESGAALMFTSGPSHGEAIGQFEGEPLYHASLAPAEYTELLHENGFQVIAHKVEDPECGNHTIWLAQMA